MASIDDEVMTLWLATNGFVNRLSQQCVIVAGPQGGTKIGGILLAEAHEQRAGAGQAHPIAGFAKIVG